MQCIIFNDVILRGLGRSLGPYKLANELRANGYSIIIIDYYSHLMNHNLLIPLIQKFVTSETLFVGFSSSFTQSTTGMNMNMDWSDVNWPGDLFSLPDETMFHIFDTISNLNPNTKIVIGGARTKFLVVDKYIKYVDYWVIDAAEASVVALANHLNLNTPIIKYPISNVVGSDVLAKESFIIAEKDYPYPEEKFNTTVVNWHPYDIIDKDEWLLMEIARGCVFNCSFCDHVKKPGASWQRTPESLTAEFIRNYELYGTTKYIFVDSTINDSMEKIQMLHSTIMALPFKIQWTSYARLDLIARFPEMGDMMVESGGKCFAFGIETFNKIAAINARKGANPDKLKEVLFNLKEKHHKNLFMCGLFITGLPGETVESQQETYNWFLNESCPLDSVYIQPLRVTIPGARYKKVVQQYSSVPLPFFSENLKAIDPEQNADTFKWINTNFTLEKANEMLGELLSTPRFKSLRNGSFSVWPRWQLQGKHRSEFIDKAQFDLDLQAYKDQWIADYQQKLLEI